MATSSHSRQCQGTVDTPFPIQAMGQGHKSDALNFAPFTPRTSFAAPSQFASDATVTGLVNRQSPIHVTFLVMTIVINSIQGMFSRWTFANVVKKLLKRLKPKLDTAPAIAVIFSIFRIQTSLSRFNIGVVFGRMLTAFRLSVLVVASCCGFTVQTSAGLSGVLLSQISNMNFSKITTGAFAPPIVSILSLFTCITQHGQTSKNFIGQIVKQSVGRFRGEYDIFFKVNHSHILTYQGDALQWR